MSEDVCHRQEYIRMLFNMCLDEMLGQGCNNKLFNDELIRLTVSLAGKDKVKKAVAEKRGRPKKEITHEEDIRYPAFDPGI